MNDVRLVTVTPDLVERLKRVLVVARAGAAGGRFPMVLEDADVIAVRLVLAEGCDSATGEPGAGSLGAGDRLLSVAAAARLVGCSPQWIRRWVGSSRLPAEKVAGVWMIPADNVEKFRHTRRAR